MTDTFAAQTDKVCATPDCPETVTWKTEVFRAPGMVLPRGASAIVDLCFVDAVSILVHGGALQLVGSES